MTQRIGFVIDRVLPHGAGNIAMLQILHASAEGHDVVLITTTASQLSASFPFETRFVPSLGEKKISGLNQKLLRASDLLTTVAASANVDRIVVHNYGRMGGNAALQALDRVAPCLIWCHDEYPHTGYHFEFASYSGVMQRTWEPWDQNRIPLGHHLALAHSLRRSVFVAPSLWLTRRLAATFGPATPVFHIPNGIDVSCFEGDHEAHAGMDGGIKALLAGSVTDPRKNLVLSLRALDVLAPQMVTSVTLAGNNGSTGAVSGKLRNFMMARGVTEDLIDKITCAGWIDDSSQMAGLYRSHNLVLHTSKAENYPTVCLEARACGTPLIATDAGGTAEAAVGARLVPTDCDRLELADRITEVATEEATSPRAGLSNDNNANTMWASAQRLLDRMEDATSAR